ncbi:hypothetical protein BS50DRAFT_210521 [Corynespora cassiicola Philippines]|uniref:Uncharacterized protein n=1 Tax=Corynespora cassiicola Philippines TaxID=1448308 RepID=A0A2T2N3Y1_CORCC|nr:hypothetical protein BS50DRAFT_210521 [Corynespora cassiicola Philippines]
MLFLGLGAHRGLRGSGLGLYMRGCSGGVWVRISPTHPSPTPSQILPTLFRGWLAGWLAGRRVCPNHPPQSSFAPNKPQSTNPRNVKMHHIPRPLPYARSLLCLRAPIFALRRSSGSPRGCRVFHHRWIHGSRPPRLGSGVDGGNSGYYKDTGRWR